MPTPCPELMILLTNCRAQNISLKSTCALVIGKFLSAQMMFRKLLFAPGTATLSGLFYPLV
jgi:hypothetical protein